MEGKKLFYLIEKKNEMIENCVFINIPSCPYTWNFFKINYKEKKMDVKLEKESKKKEKKKEGNQCWKGKGADE